MLCVLFARVRSKTRFDVIFEGQDVYRGVVQLNSLFPSSFSALWRPCSQFILLRTEIKDSFVGNAFSISVAMLFAPPWLMRAVRRWPWHFSRREQRALFRAVLLKQCPLHQPFIGPSALLLPHFRHITLCASSKMRKKGEGRETDAGIFD